MKTHELTLASSADEALEALQEGLEPRLLTLGIRTWDAEAWRCLGREAALQLALCAMLRELRNEIWEREIARLEADEGYDGPLTQPPGPYVAEPVEDEG